MNIHLPAILGFTRYQGFDPSPSGLPEANDQPPAVRLQGRSQSGVQGARAAECGQTLSSRIPNDLSAW